MRKYEMRKYEMRKYEMRKYEMRNIKWEIWNEKYIEWEI